MRSNYKRLGDYIRPVDIRNTQGQVTRLLGVSIEKKFISSIANTIGTDMSTYKIVKRGQFAYGPVTSRNGDKVSIALLHEDECIISSSYSVFEVIDSGILLPEYLMLWFRRAEFDRYARFHSHGSAREIFDWEEMCNVELPIPPIEEQKAIVNAYETIERRIALKRKINDNLVDFSKCKLHRFLDQNSDIEKVQLYKLCVDIKAGGTPSRSVPEYWNRKDYQWVKNGEVKNNIIIETEEYISRQGFCNSSAKLVPPFSILMAMYCVSMPQLAINIDEVTTNQAVCAMTCKNEELSAFLYYYLMFYGQELINNANGSAQINLSKETIAQYLVPNLSDEQLSSLNLAISIRYRSEIAKEIRVLTSLQTDLIAQLSR